MTEVVTRPTGVLNSAGINTTGAASAWQAVADDSDTSYIDLNANDAKIRFNIGPPTAPSGELCYSIRWRMRTNKVVQTGAIDSHPEIQGFLDGQGGPMIPGRNTTTIAMPSLTRVSWRNITTTRVSSSYPDTGVPISVSPTGITLRLVRDGDDNSWRPRVYSIEVITLYVRPPVVTTLRPSGAISSTHPEIIWENTRLDRAGGPQTFWHLRIFDDAAYGAGGFNVNTSGGQDYGSGVVSGSTNRHDLSNENALIADTYRAYVRAAQTVHGQKHWSAWSWKEFTIGSPRPGVPTFSLHPDDNNGRIRIQMNATSGGLATEFFQVHSTTNPSDANSWQPIRTSYGDRGYVRSTGTTNVYDYEAKNNVTTSYRVRAVYFSGNEPQPNDPSFVPSNFTNSNWAATQSAKWVNDEWFFKHPYESSKNLTRSIRSQPSRTRSARAEVFQPLGRAPEESIVVSDTYQSWTGELIVRNNNDGERAAWDALIGDGLPLLVHAPDWVPDWRDAWMHLSEHSRERIVDNSNFDITWDRIAFQQVGRPISAQTDNPPISSVASEPPAGEPQTSLDATEAQ